MLARSGSPLISRTFSTPRHTTHYLECGQADGPLMIFLHGWPGISLVWRAQMNAFADDGWHCVAPDLRGYASIYQPGDPAGVGKVSPNAVVSRNGGRFGAAHHAPPTQPDPDLWPPADFDALLRAFQAHGFGPACAWYLNDDANIAYAGTAPDDGRLSQPVLFVNGDFDQICSTTGNRQGDPMRAACTDLTETSMPAGHWLPLERKEDHIAAIRTWLQEKNL